MCDTLKMFTYLQRFRNILFFSLSRDKDRDYRSGLSAAKWRGSVGKFYCYSLKSVTSNPFFFFKMVQNTGKEQEPYFDPSVLLGFFFGFFFSLA